MNLNILMITLEVITKTELDRIKKIEETLNGLSYLLKGVGSKNQLNQLLILADSQIKQLETKVDSLETEIAALTISAQKLQ